MSHFFTHAKVAGVVAAHRLSQLLIATASDEPADEVNPPNHSGIFDCQ
jgi:hypothetical protein